MSKVRKRKKLRVESLSQVENKMSKSARIVLVLAMVSAIGACAKKEEPAPAPVVVEVPDTGKL